MFMASLVGDIIRVSFLQFCPGIKARLPALEFAPDNISSLKKVVLNFRRAARLAAR